jgi:hypothetical protein
MTVMPEVKQAFNILLFVKRVHSRDTQAKEKLVCAAIASM